MECGSDFWRFSLTLYRMKNVPSACIALQDTHGLDVNLMLFALWLASNGRAVSSADVSEADAAVREWREQVVIALRGVRRALRSPAPTIDAPAAEQLRAKIKAVELESERLQQEALYKLKPVDSWGRPESAAHAGEANMVACEQAIGAIFHAEPRAALLAAYREIISAAKP